MTFHKCSQVFQFSKFFSTSFHLFLILCINHTFSQEADPIIGSNQLQTCHNFQNAKQRFILIPTSRTNRAINNAGGKLHPKPIRFQLKPGEKLNCVEEKAEIRTFSLELELDADNLVGRNFKSVPKGSTPPHPHSYFTTSGYFYDNITSAFYKPGGDYCLQSNSTKEITLKVCAVNDACSGSSSPKNAWCLPKCCAVDEVLLYWKRQCVRQNETDGATPWIPPIYDSKNPKRKLGDLTNKNLIFKMANLPKTCNMVTHADGTQTKAFYKWVVASTATHPKTGDKDLQDYLKLVAPASGTNGIVQAMGLFHNNRTWMVMDNWEDFCIEGFFINTPDFPTYTGKEDHFVIYYCAPDKEESQETATANSWVYVVTSFLALFFLLATILIYVLLWEKQNLHGLTILSYVVATFGSYLFLVSAHLVYLFPNKEVTGLHTRGPLCYGIAVLAHFFFIASYLWLTVMNFDLWLTFSSIRTARRDSKEWRRFGMYSLVAWFLPVMLVAAFIMVDEVYRDPITLVPVPDYATSTCFVSPDFRGEYVYIPMAIMLVVNIVLIGMTMWIFIKARMHMTKTFSEGASNANQYSYKITKRINAKLFCKLFIVMGGTSVVDFLTWYYNNSGEGKPWLIVVLESITYLTPVVLFVLFCLNDRIINQMRETYPKFTEYLEPVLAIFEKRDERTETMTNHSTASYKTSCTTTSVSQKDGDNTHMKMRAINNH